MLTSTVCRYEDFLTEWYAHWAETLGLPAQGANAPKDLIVHRKHWEWCAISQALQERGLLQPGKSGYGFAVGTEPLPAAFAARGARILATDQAMSDAANSWVKTGQHAATLDALYRPDIISRAEFDDRVAFRPADMRDLSSFQNQKFDFIWSSCSIEHLGSLEAGWEFVLNAMELVKDGGVAIHTTEYNVTSNSTTIEAGEDVVYRQQDIEQLDRRLRLISCGLARCDFYAGDHPNDLSYDHWVFFKNKRPHVKLQIHGHVATSMILIIQKGARADAAVESAFVKPQAQPADPPFDDRLHALEMTIAELQTSLARQTAKSVELETRLNDMPEPFASRAARVLRRAIRGRK